MGRDLLVPLKYEVSETGLKLKNPKTGISTLFEFASVSSRPAYLSSLMCQYYIRSAKHEC